MWEGGFWGLQFCCVVLKNHTEVAWVGLRPYLTALTPLMYAASRQGRCCSTPVHVMPPAM